MDKELNIKFYEKTLRPDRQRSYKLIVDFIMKNINPDIKSVIDYGCGAGWFLYYFKKDYNIKDITGIEPNKHSIEVSDELIKKNIKHIDLSIKDLNIEKRFDLSLCIEVIEHIDKKFENIVIDNITSNSNLLIFSAAYPGQGGYGHINENEFEYWINKLKNKNFILNKDKTKEFRKYLKHNNSMAWYYKNIGVFTYAPQPIL